MSNAELLDAAGRRNPARRNALMEDREATGRPGRLRSLLARGADPNAVDGFRDTPALHIAAELGDVASVEVLLEYGAQVDGRRSDAKTALHAIAQNRRRSVLEVLLARGADPNAADKHGRTPLHDWCAWGEAQGVRLLLEAGASPRAEMTDGQTPLFSAARRGRPDLVALLLEAGADPEHMTRSHTDPLDEARSHDAWRVVELLSEHLGRPISLDGSDDPVTEQLEAYARRLGVRAARAAIDSGDHDYFADDDDLDPDDLPYEFWSANYGERATSAAEFLARHFPGELRDDVRIDVLMRELFLEAYSEAVG